MVDANQPITHVNHLNQPPHRDVITVSQLNEAVQDLLNKAFPLLWICGELSNLAQPGSGHWYFTLKDSGAQVRCAMFRMRNQVLKFFPQNGAQVLVRARVGLYTPRGDYQLVVEHIEPAGDGLLRQRFEMLKQQLAAEGLFEPEHKKPLPSYPAIIGIITSPTGAALQDILHVLQRRYPYALLRIYPVAVQGEGAVRDITAMIRTASRGDCDVIILARGGGSLEDLWAFNEEPVARAIAACGVPLVTGIGHEIDTTIADFVADQRAPTPSAAAELVSPNQAELRQTFVHLLQQLMRRMQFQLGIKTTALDRARKRLRHPRQRILTLIQRTDELGQRLQRSMRHLIQYKAAHAQSINARLLHHSPMHSINTLTIMQRALQQRLTSAMQHNLEGKRQILRSTVRALDAVSPLSTLGRGYAIVRDPQHKTIIHSARDVKPGDTVEALLGQGRLVCAVNAIYTDNFTTKK